jgi:integrase/recombinase XerD
MNYLNAKAALALFWDLNARNHEITLLKIKHVRLEKYGEGEIPHEAKTGTGPILLTCLFPYVSDWLNERPFRNESNARLICNRYIAGAIKLEAVWSRIISLIKEGSITNKEEKEKLEYLLHTKKWNPYCKGFLQSPLIQTSFLNMLLRKTFCGL